MTGSRPSLLDLIVRDVRVQDAFLPVTFFLLVTVIATFAAGPDAALLQRIGPGFLWTGLLLAFLLPVADLFRRDRLSGVLDQHFVRGFAPELVTFARTLSLWISVGVPLAATSVPAGLLLNVPVGDVMVPLVTGSVALSALAVAAGALVVGARGGEAVASLIVLPLAAPIVIFGVGGDLRLLGAAAIFLLFLCPLAAGAALRQLG
ncbi:MAG: heme exporter protein CcmB [Pacificimonas sp.]|jgi:heme exporter protein B|nr:heme exporter protein CcmB [Pacificimonas sp.]